MRTEYAWDRHKKSRPWADGLGQGVARQHCLPFATALRPSLQRGKTFARRISLLQLVPYTGGRSQSSQRQLGRRCSPLDPVVHHHSLGLPRSSWAQVTATGGSGHSEISKGFTAHSATDEARAGEIGGHDVGTCTGQTAAAADGRFFPARSSECSLCLWHGSFLLLNFFPIKF